MWNTVGRHRCDELVVAGALVYNLGVVVEHRCDEDGAGHCAVLDATYDVVVVCQNDGGSCLKVDEARAVGGLCCSGGELDVRCFLL